MDSEHARYFYFRKFTYDTSGNKQSYKLLYNYLYIYSEDILYHTGSYG